MRGVVTNTLHSYVWVGVLYCHFSYVSQYYPTSIILLHLAHTQTCVQSSMSIHLSNHQDWWILIWIIIKVYLPTFLDFPGVYWVCCESLGFSRKEKNLPDFQWKQFFFWWASRGGCTSRFLECHKVGFLASIRGGANRGFCWVSKMFNVATKNIQQHPHLPKSNNAEITINFESQILFKHYHTFGHQRTGFTTDYLKLVGEAALTLYISTTHNWLICQLHFRYVMPSTGSLLATCNFKAQSICDILKVFAVRP